MKRSNLLEIVLFIFGFIFGLLINLSYKYSDDKNFSEKKVKSEILSSNTLEENYIDKKFDASLAENLFNEIKIVCLVLTQPADHQSKAQYVKNTWGSKCNKLIFLSTEVDDELGTIAFPYNESRDILWGKVRGGFLYAYENHFDDADWFLKADDDSYFIMENLRYILYQYRPQTSIYIGHRYSMEFSADGYMAGGGYILSKKALSKFATKLIHDPNCRDDPGGPEDLEMGLCLETHAIPLDGHNLLGQKQFFPVGVEEHFINQTLNWWYPRNQWFQYPDGGIECCADTIACLHYIPPEEMYLFNYLIYNVHPFGFIKNGVMSLPRKLSFNEILNQSDVKSLSPNYEEHKFVHLFDDDEKY